LPERAGGRPLSFPLALLARLGIPETVRLRAGLAYPAAAHGREEAGMERAAQVHR